MPLETTPPRKAESQEELLAKKLETEGGKSGLREGKPAGKTTTAPIDDSGTPSDASKPVTKSDKSDLQKMKEAQAIKDAAAVKKVRAEIAEMKGS